MVAPISADYGDEVAINCGSALAGMADNARASRACENARSERALIGVGILLLILVVVVVVVVVGVGVGGGIFYRRSTRLVGSSQSVSPEAD